MLVCGFIIFVVIIVWCLLVGGYVCYVNVEYGYGLVFGVYMYCLFGFLVGGWFGWVCGVVEVVFGVVGDYV